eukprot:scaffold138976_cov37-Prasinocladus_malaysianus.AAC.1
MATCHLGPIPEPPSSLVRRPRKPESYLVDFFHPQRYCLNSSYVHRELDAALSGGANSQCQANITRHSSDSCVVRQSVPMD